jgi:hypothetical protein
VIGSVAVAASVAVEATEGESVKGVVIERRLAAVAADGSVKGVVIEGESVEPVEVTVAEPEVEPVVVD